MADEALEVNQKTFARIVSRTTRQIRNLHELGLPSRVDPETGERLYDLLVAVPWFVGHREDLLRPNARDDAETRRSIAKARLVELELAEREGDLVRLDVVEEELGDVLGEVRARFMNLPGRVATQLLGMEDQRDVVAVLQPAVDECLYSMEPLWVDLLAGRSVVPEPIPDDFPFVTYLRDAGVTSRQELLRGLDTLEELPRIGAKRAARIREAAQEWDWEAAA